MTSTEHLVIDSVDIYIIPLPDNQTTNQICSDSSRRDLFDGIGALSRRRERAAEILLLDSLYPGGVWNLAHRPDRSPILTVGDLEVECSLSHSRTHLALAVSRDGHPVGIDIENQTNRLQRLASQFLNAEEREIWCASSERLLMAWTAKEAAFKLMRGAPHSLSAVRLGSASSTPVEASFGRITSNIYFHTLSSTCLALAR
ncbi:MAG: 4'-phosphopantetheinyl transferase superfamily protein [Clostridium sp.]|nr:4'-phosphopantetheinyl transferase superfamily protein [Clostridium sp.]